MNDEAPVALVTGARKGIGRYLAEHLVRQGYRVVGCSRNPIDWELAGYTHYQADVTDEHQARALIRKVGQMYNRLDVLLNNAALASMNHALLTPASTVESLLRTNVVGTFLVSREAAKLMKQRTYGRIVNFSSVAVPLRLAGQAAYVASKCAVEGLSQVLARELAEFGITVNVVGPPPTDTDMIRGVPKDKIARLVDAMPLKRLGTCEDIAAAVDYFVRPDSGAITGQIMYLNGVPNS
jgi:3-oxoacyl-[acyl-carrier protein] reductase